MVIVIFVEKLLYIRHFNDYLFLSFMIIGIKISQFSFLLWWNISNGSFLEVSMAPGSVKSSIDS